MRIVHLADLHLGYRQYGMPERQDDYLVATAYVFNRAIELKADVINLGGDIFHSVHPPASAVYFLYSQIHKAKAAGIEVVGIDGNHDSTETAWLRVCGATPLAQWDDEGRLKLHETKGIRYTGINGGRPSTIRAALDQFAATADRQQRIDIVAMHLPLAEMAGFEGVEMSARVIADKLKPLGVRCVLLGDIHDYKETVIGDIRFIYSGSPEMTALDEQEDKSFSVIDITENELKTAVEFTPVRAVVHKHVSEETELDTVLAEVKAATVDPRRLPLVVLTYDPAVTGLKQKADNVLQGRALPRIMPLIQGHTMDIFGQISERSEVYERKGAMRNLKEVVRGRFGEDSDEFALIVACIEQPDQVDNTIISYANEKGLKVR